MKRFRSMIVVLACLAVIMLGCVAAATWIVAAPAHTVYPETEICLHVEGGGLDELEPFVKPYTDNLTGSGLGSSAIVSTEKLVKVFDQFKREYTVDLNSSGLSDGATDLQGEVLAGSTYIATYNINEATIKNVENGEILKSTEFHWADNKTPTIQRLIKYQTVWIGSGTIREYANQTLYTIEDALNTATNSQTVVVEHNTSFATADVAKAAEYDKLENAYNVRGTLLVPYGASASGYKSISTGPNMSLGNASDRKATNTVTDNSSNPNRTNGYSKLVVPSNTTLMVTGTLIVNAVLSIRDAATTYVNAGNYGELEVGSEAKIVLQNKSTFYGLGFTSGEGSIEVQNGATLHEPMNATGFKGHNPTRGDGEIAFPINQFTLASIACITTFEYGAQYLGSAYVGLGTPAYGADANLLGNKSDSFIQLFNGAKLTKSVNTANGKITFALEGDVSINNLDIAKVSVGNISFNLQTSGFQIPLAGHFAIAIKSGTLTIPDGVQIKLLPGADLTVEKDATLDIKSGGALYAYGEDNTTIEKYTQFKDGIKAYPVTGAGGTAEVYKSAVKLDYDATKPATMCIEGTLNVVGNATFGTEIAGVEGGKLHIEEGAKFKGTINEGDSVDTGTKSYQVSFDSFGLNEETEATPLGVGDWNYIEGRWVGNYYQVIYNANGGTLTGEETELYKHAETLIKTTNPTRDYFTFTGWYYDEACESKAEVLSQEAGDVVTLYAGWDPIKYSIEFKVGYLSDFDHTAVTIPAEERTWSYGETLDSLPQPFWDETSLAGLVFSGWCVKENYTVPFTSINNDTIKDFTIENGKIIIYGSLRLDNEFAVTFISEHTFYTAENEEQHKLNSLYAHGDLPNDVTGEYGQAVSRIDEASKVITDKVKDDNTHEYYFNGWYAIVNGERQVVDASTPIQREWLTDGTLTLHADWVQKPQIHVDLFDNYNHKSTNVVIAPTGGTKFTVQNSVEGGYNYYYYYPAGTSIDVTMTGRTGLASDFKTTTYPDIYININTTRHATAKDKDTRLSSTFSMPDTGTVLIYLHSNGGTIPCIVEGTLITMADGTQKPVEDLQIGDMVLVFNHETGRYESCALWSNVHAGNEAEWSLVTYLKFSDGTELGIINEHALFDKTLNRYVYLNAENPAEYFGHKFVTVQDVNGEYVSGEVTLVGFENREEFVRVFSPVSLFHMNVVTNGLLSMTAWPTNSEGFENYFAFDEDMKYDEEAMQADIEKYGLYTYEDFKDLMTEDLFNALPWKYFKIAVGKGMMTWEDILYTIEWIYTTGQIQLD